MIDKFIEKINITSKTGCVLICYIYGLIDYIIKISICNLNTDFYYN
jgi:hypothetical protein